MADITSPVFANADDQNRQQQAGLLAAIAQAGSNGRAMFDQQVQQAQAARQAAIANAAQRASGIGAPVGLQGQLQQQAGQPGDSQMADIGAARTMFGQDIAAQQQANQNYMGQVRAALPLVQARASAEVAALQQRAQEDAQQRALQRQLAEQEYGLKQQEYQQKQRERDLGIGGTPAEQKLQQADYEKQSKQFVLDKLSQNAAPYTQDLFNDIVRATRASDLPSALSKLRQVQQNTNVAGQVIAPDGSGKVVATYDPRAFNKDSLAALQDWLRRYYAADERVNMASAAAHSGPAQQ